MATPLKRQFRNFTMQARANGLQDQYVESSYAHLRRRIYSNDNTGYGLLHPLTKPKPEQPPKSEATEAMPKVKCVDNGLGDVGQKRPSRPFNVELSLAADQMAEKECWPAQKPLKQSPSRHDYRPMYHTDHAALHKNQSSVSLHATPIGDHKLRSGDSLATIIEEKRSTSSLKSTSGKNRGDKLHSRGSLASIVEENHPPKEVTPREDKLKGGESLATIIEEAKEEPAKTRPQSRIRSAKPRPKEKRKE